MPKVLSISLIAVLLLIVGRPFAPYAEYSLGKSRIIRELCENRTRPELKCNGKCYLSKQLKKAANRRGDADAPFQVKELEEIAQYLPTGGFISLSIHSTSESSEKVLSPLKSQWIGDPIGPPPRKLV